MKAILIDTPTRTVRAVELPDRVGASYRLALEAVYRELGIDTGSRLIQAVPYALLDGSDLAYVDEEGLLRAATLALGRFVITGNGERLAGRGIVIGTTRDGEWRDVQTSVEDVQTRVAFLP